MADLSSSSTQPAPISDRDWVTQIQDENPQAWQLLNEALYHWIFTHLRTRLYWLDAETVADWARECTQDAGERILQRLHLYAGRGSFLGWCRVLALNVTIDWMRRDARARQFAPHPLSEQTAQEDASLDAVERQIVLTRLFEQIEHLIQTELSQRERAILLAGEGQNEALAATLGIQTNYLYQLRFRAHQKIRRRLQKMGYTRQKLMDWDIL